MRANSPNPFQKLPRGVSFPVQCWALLSVINSKNDADTIIFDEIDAGISGRAADKVGIRLAKTAENSQVICITHLAQIASKGNSHYLIEKSIRRAKDQDLGGKARQRGKNRGACKDNRRNGYDRVHTRRRK